MRKFVALLVAFGAFLGVPGCKKEGPKPKGGHTHDHDHDHNDPNHKHDHDHDHGTDPKSKTPAKDVKAPDPAAKPEVK